MGRFLDQPVFCSDARWARRACVSAGEALPIGRAEGRRRPPTLPSGRPSVRCLAHRLSILGGLLVVSLVASAYLMAVAVSVGHHPWIGWLGLFPLFVAVRVERPVFAMLAGGLWGTALWLSLAGLGGEGAGGLALALLALTPAVYGFAGSWLTRRVGFSPFVLGVGWIGVELALQPLGFRYGILASTQGDCWFLQVVGDLFGYLLVSFAAALFTAWLVAFVLHLATALVAERPIPACCACCVTRLRERLVNLCERIAHSLRPRAPPAVRDHPCMSS